MNFLTPTGFLLAALALPILLLYMLKLRRREISISSTMLWQKLLKDRQANTPWQRLKRNLLLILQLAVLGALVFAFARPYLPLPSVVAGSTVILLDGSASMQATDRVPNRFEAAREAARTIIEGLTAQSRATLVLVGEQPQVLIAGESNKSSLFRALDSAQPGQSTADWEAAAAVASSAISPSAEESQIVVISDGGIPDGTLTVLPGETRYLNIGAGNDNLAIAALAARPGSSGVELFTRVENYSSRDRQGILSFYVNDELFAAQPISVAAKNSAQVVISDLPIEAAVYQARLANPDGLQTALDQLSLDDQAYTIYRPPANSRVLSVSGNPEGNYFLEQLLNLLLNITPFKSLYKETNSGTLPDERFDIYIFDGVLPDTLPDGNLLLINPPSNELFSVQGSFTPVANVRITDHPLTRFLDWDEVHIAEARRVELPEWGESLISAAGETLVFAGDQQGRRIVVLTFDLHDSDLPLRVAYPILFANIFDYLNPGENSSFPDQLNPGDILSTRIDPGIQSVEIVTPSGESQILIPNEDGIIYTNTSSLGLYRVQLRSQAETVQAYFSVNLNDPVESDITPQESIQIGRSTIVASTPTEIGQQEIWWVFAVLGLVLLLMEWWFYHRGQSPTFVFWQNFRSRLTGRRLS